MYEYTDGNNRFFVTERKNDGVCVGIVVVGRSSNVIDLPREEVLKLIDTLVKAAEENEPDVNGNT